MNVGEVEVVVTGSRTRATNLPGSVAVIGEAQDGGKRKVLESSLNLDWELTKHLLVQSRLWRKKSVSSRYADWTYEGVGQTESHAKEWVSGGLVSVNSAWPLPMDQELSMEGGADYRHYDSNVSNWVTEARVRQRVNTMDHYDLHNGGLYAKVNHDMMHLVGLFGGVRQDVFWGQTRNRLTGDHTRMPEYYVTTYKAGTIVSPLSELNF